MYVYSHPGVDRIFQEILTKIGILLNIPYSTLRLYVY